MHLSDLNIIKTVLLAIENLFKKALSGRWGQKKVGHNHYSQDTLYYLLIV